MLWTVYRDLPFEQRLERMAEAGFKNVELVGEYSDWSEDDFRRINARRKQLGISLRLHGWAETFSVQLRRAGGFCGRIP